jgi:Gpi18-like mannosyltransferase
MIEVSGYVYSLNWITALKVSYFIVDIINAIAVYCIIYRVTSSQRKATAGYVIFSALPVQFINSAVWGQADCIYTCFLLWTVYYALGEKGKRAFLMVGFALSFKLQALFLAPFLVYLLLRRKVKFSDALCAPAAVLISFLPAYICGASFIQPFMFFGKQVGGYSDLNMGCANFWQLFVFRDSRMETINPGVVFMALLFIGAICAVVWLRMVRNTNENLLNIAAFLVGVTVFFLPHMHERYFYLLDVLAVVYAFSKGKRYSLIVLMQIVSGIAYQNYIGGKYFIKAFGEDSVHIAAFIVIGVLGVLLYDILHSEHSTKEEVLEEIKKAAGKRR